MISDNEKKMISVVIPVFNEEEVLPEMCGRLHSTLEGLRLRWEVIFVDDGSADGSLPILMERARQDPRFKILSLSRNFGHQQALTAGILRARGDAVVMMDADLQDPPEVIPELAKSWSEGNQVVLAVRRSRAESGPRRLSLGIFYRALKFLIGSDMGLDSGIFCLIDRRAAASFNRLEERNRYIPGLRSWIGFRRGIVLYDREERRAGTPKQNFWRLFAYATDAVFSFSYKPLRIASISGAVFWLVSGAYGIVLIAARLLQINVVMGFTTTTVAVFFIGGFQLLCLGIVGEYIARIYEEVKRRPLFIEREFINFEKPHP